MSFVIDWASHSAQAIEWVQAQGVLAYPTEAVYGIGGDASSDAVIERVFALKTGRDRDKGFVILVQHWSQCEGWIRELGVQDLRKMSQIAAQRATTFVLPAGPLLPEALQHPDRTVAVRCTKHPVAQALCAAIAAPLISTSANYVGEPPARNWQVVRKMFPELPVIDAPLGDEKTPSRIMTWPEQRVLRF